MLLWFLLCFGNEASRDRYFSRSVCRSVSTQLSKKFLPLLWSIVEYSRTIQAPKILPILPILPSSATLRPFSLAEQFHTQNFYLRCFKSDFDAVKGKFGLVIEQIEMATSNSATLRPFSLAEQCHTQNFYLRCFKSDFDAVKGKFGLLIEQIEMATSNSATLKPFSLAEQ